MKDPARKVEARGLDLGRSARIGFGVSGEWRQVARARRAGNITVWVMFNISA